MVLATWLSMLTRLPRRILLACTLASLAACQTDPTGIGDNGKEDSAPDQLDHDALLFVNKERCLPCGFSPTDLVSAAGTMVRAPVKPWIEKMAADAKAATGQELFAASGFRSFDTQVAVLANESVNFGPCTATGEVAPPGRSEHQLGTAMDLASRDASGTFVLDAFGPSKAGRWVAQHAFEYGFVLSYPLGRQAITGYRHESWHYRWVGRAIAAEIKKNGWSVQEYMENVAPPTALEPMECEACQPARGVLSGCPTELSNIWTCGTKDDSTGARVRCELGLITCEACADSCTSQPTGQDDTCAGGVAPPACEDGVFALWTCNDDGSARVRCQNAQTETEQCANGCTAFPTGQDDQCAP